ncbi:MAG: hypothetical protein AMJ54_10500 [Deltaproteobacteria bacterium SG8_13]|nr:MAG: hypothetical protein AMJ54_10500 [Deltaproteobacteria bacterium SG8_13]
MAKVKLATVPTQTLSYIIILGGGVVLFLLLAILPAHKETAALDFEIDNVNTKIEEQKILTPVYESLLKKVQLKPPEGLNYVAKEKLKTEDTHKVAARFQDMAKNSRLTLVEFSPAVETLINRSGFMMVDIELRGEFINLHPFLLQMCQLPYLEQIEEIRIRSVRDTKEMKIRMWLTTES